LHRGSAELKVINNLPILYHPIFAFCRVLGQVVAAKAVSDKHGEGEAIQLILFSQVSGIKSANLN
jgi:hypothetical protein